MGLILALYVHSAAIQDRDGVKPLLIKAWNLGWLRKIWAASGSAGKLETWFAGLKLGPHAKLEIIRKIASGFQLWPCRWVIERTFAWLGRDRRLSRDDEVKTSRSEAFIYIAACRLMLRRLAKSSAT